MKKRILSWILLLSMLASLITTVPIVTNAMAYNTPTKILYYNGHSYAVFDNFMQWSEAKEYCYELDGHLATITSIGEQNFINGILKNQELYWIGGQKNKTSWEWITYEPFTYTNWDNGEPNNITNSENTLMIYGTNENYSRKGKWNDTIAIHEKGISHYYNKFGFICEWDCEISSYWAQITYNNATLDLLSQPVNVMKDSDIEVSVKVDNPSKNSNEKIYLTQNTQNAIELQNNVSKSFKPAKVFDAGKDIYILIVNEQTGDAKSYRTRLMITDKTATGEWFPSSGVEGLNFKLGKSVGFTIPDKVPVFGGTEIKWDFGFIPISFEYDKEDSNKINIVFGTNIATSDPDSKTGYKYFKDFDFKEYKKGVKKASTKQGRTLKQLRNDFKMTDAKKFNLFGDKVIGGGSGEGAIDFDIAGYAEMKVIDGELKFTEGQLCLNVEVSYTYQGQLFIWVVPVYYEIGGGIGAGFEGDMINIDPDNFTPEFEAYITAKIKAEIGAGIGIAKVATVGAAGEGSLNIKAALHKDYQKAWGEGSANINVKVFGKEVAKSDFWNGNFLIYETGNSNGLIKSNAVKLMSANNNLYDSIDINKVYENESRAYNQSSPKWCGDKKLMKLMSAEFSSKNQKLLAENVYTESAPQMCEINGKKVLVTLWDDSERSDANRTMLVYSVYDDTSDTWSAPVPVANDGTADFYPCFNDGYLVWQNQKQAVTDTMTLADIAGDGEICLAKWNGSGFDTPITLTDNSMVDTQPFVVSNDGKASVVWSTNTQNDIIGITGTNSLMKSELSGTVWNEPVCVKSGLNAIMNLSAGYIDNELNIAYVADKDNDLQTIDDRDISVITEDSELLLTDNDILDSNPEFSGNRIYYYSNGNIEYSSVDKSVQGKVFAEAKPGLTDTFTVSSNSNNDTAIWWTKNVENGIEIFCALNQNGEWSDEIQLSSAGNQSRYPTGILNNDGSMYIAFNNATWSESDIVKTDLYTLSLVPSYDMSIENAYIDEDTMTVYATVKNSGELPIDEYTVSIFDNNIENSKLTVTEPIKAGETKDIGIQYVKPENLTEHSITVNISTANEEYDLNNNSVDLTVGHCDIAVEKLENYEILPMSTIIATISNIGYSDSGKVTLTLRKNTTDGEITETQIINNLSSGESKEVTFNYNIVENDDIQWYVTATAENEEIILSNNDDYALNNYKNEVAPLIQDIVRYSYVDNQLTVNAYIENNTENDIDAVSVLGLYSSSGKLKAIKMQNTEIDQYYNTAVNFAISDCAYQEGDYIKLFLLDSVNSIMPLTESKTVQLIIQ